MASRAAVMVMMMLLLQSAFFLAVLCDDTTPYLDVTGTVPPPPPPRPYAFGYAAGRAPGHIDRTHSEVSDGHGVIQGSYSYVDPRNRIRTVDYTADSQGFHPVLSHNPSPLPKDTFVVAAAKERHLNLYASIADGHQRLPGDTAAVQKARDRHLSLYDEIAREHARIALERGVEAEEEEKIEEGGDNNLVAY